MEEQKSSTIFINPKFKNAYINPNFLKSSASTPQIHFNPKFLQQQQIAQQQQQQTKPQQVTVLKPNVSSSSAIIKNTKRSLIRAPPVLAATSQIPPVSSPSSSIPKKNLIKISNTKLIKASQLMKYQQKENEKIKDATKSQSKGSNVKNTESIYKLDRRKASTGSIQKKPSPAKSLSRSRLQKAMALKSRNFSAAPNTKTLVIHGQKYVLDPSGRKLKRQSNQQTIRDHLTQAKTKSISVLQRTSTSLSSSSLPSSKISSASSMPICPIYRRIGKCLAYAKGRCSKSHDPRYVMVCQNFIRGSCTNSKCLLSHNANLHKMPVCKYYLQGTCLKDECLYLHKKVSDGTKLCSDFVKGYCPLADKCNLLHDHIDSDRKKYSFVRGSVSVAKRKKATAAKKEAPPLIPPLRPVSNRYFEDASPSPTVQNNIPKFSKKAPALPDFIAL